MKHSLYAAAVALMAAPAAQAIDAQTAMQSYLDAHVMEWSGDATILAAVTAQNARTAGLTAAEIDQLDKAWRAEVGTADAPTITPVLENPAADLLREKVAASGGAITEIFVMDAQGLNVAASSVTSDYWQGDEAKHQETYGKGAGAVHFSAIEFDESSQMYQAQISISLSDPDTGAVIGAMTIGVDADSLM